MAAPLPPVPLLAVIGPTASGKSALALQLAIQTPAEILSLDSMQVYRGLDIGTAKPTPAEQALVPHHGIDLVEPTEPFSVARFLDHADAVIADARQRNVPLIAVGGTPLYYKALFEGLFEGPAADPDLRQTLAATPPEELHARLTQVDPESASRIHVNDSRRLVRALEVFQLTGIPISRQQSQWGSQLRHPVVWVGIDWPRPALNQRINARVRQMLEAGWLEEVRQHATRLGMTAASATGYAQLLDHLAGRTTLQEAAEQIKIATRQLARRQSKWLRRFANTTWLPGEMPLEQKVHQVQKLWPPKP